MITPDELDAIKQEVAHTLTIGIPMHQSYAEAALEAIDRGLANAQADPTPFAVGRRVELIELPHLKGSVARRVEFEGELHTVVIVWDIYAGETPYSPTQVREVVQ